MSSFNMVLIEEADANFLLVYFNILKELIPKKQEALKAIVKQHGDTIIGQISVSSVVGGMRGLNCM